MAESTFDFFLQFLGAPVRTGALHRTCSKTENWRFCILGDRMETQTGAFCQICRWPNWSTENDCFFLPLSSHQSHKNRNFPMKLSGVMLWECENMHRNFQRLSETIATFWYSQRFSRTQCPHKKLTLCSPFSLHHSHKN